MSGGRISVGAQSSMRIRGNVAAAAGTVDVGVTLIFEIVGGSINSLIPLGSVQINPGAANTVSLASNLVLQAGCTLQSGTFAAGAFNLSLAGDFTNTGGAFTSGAILTFNGGGAQAFNPAGSTFTNVTVNGTGPVNLGGTLTVGGTLTLTLGTLVAGANNVLVAGDFVNTGGVFTSGATLTFNGAGAQAFNPTGSTFTNVIVNGTGPVNLGGTLTVGGTLTLTLGTLAAGANNVLVAGDFVRTGGVFTSGATLTFNGAGAQAFNPTGSTFTNVTVSGAGPVNLGGTLTVGGTLTLALGTASCRGEQRACGRGLREYRWGVHLGGDPYVQRGRGAGVQPDGLHLHEHHRQ